MKMRESKPYVFEGHHLGHLGDIVLLQAGKDLARTNAKATREHPVPIVLVLASEIRQYVFLNVQADSVNAYESTAPKSSIAEPRCVKLPRSPRKALRL